MDFKESVENSASINRKKENKELTFVQINNILAIKCYTANTWNGTTVIHLNIYIDVRKTLVSWAPSLSYDLCVIIMTIKCVSD